MWRTEEDRKREEHHITDLEQFEADRLLEIREAQHIADTRQILAIKKWLHAPNQDEPNQENVEKILQNLVTREDNYRQHMYNIHVHPILSHIFRTHPGYHIEHLKQRAISLHLNCLVIREKEKKAIELIKQNVQFHSSEKKSNDELVSFVQREASQELSKIEHKRKQVETVKSELLCSLEHFNGIYTHLSAVRYLAPSYLRTVTNRHNLLIDRAHEVLERTQLPDPEFDIILEHADILRVRVINEEGTKLFPNKYGECFTVHRKEYQEPAPAVDVANDIERTIDRMGKKWYELDHHQRALRNYCDRVLDIQAAIIAFLTHHKTEESNENSFAIATLLEFVRFHKLKELDSIRLQSNEVDKVKSEIETTMTAYTDMCSDEAKMEQLHPSYLAALQDKLNALLSNAYTVLVKPVAGQEFNIEVGYNGGRFVIVTKSDGKNVYPNNAM